MRLRAAVFVVIASIEAFQVTRPATCVNRGSTPSFQRPRRLLTTTKSLRGGAVVKTARAAIMRYPLAAVGAALAVGVGAGLFAAAPVMDDFGRYHTVADIPNHRFQDHDSFLVVIVKVADGDTMRGRHVPALDFARGRWRSKSRAEGGKLKLSEETLQIRLYAVDAPETAKFGNEGMPLGDEATAFARERLDGKRVRITLQSKDQYGRAVAKLSYGLFRKDLSGELLANGLATVYCSGGAEYGPGKIEADWNAIEDRARRASALPLPKTRAPQPVASSQESFRRPCVYKTGPVVSRATHQENDPQENVAASAMASAAMTTAGSRSSRAHTPSPRTAAIAAASRNW